METNSYQYKRGERALIIDDQAGHGLQMGLEVTVTGSDSSRRTSWMIRTDTGSAYSAAPKDLRPLGFSKNALTLRHKELTNQLGEVVNQLQWLDDNKADMLIWNDFKLDEAFKLITSESTSKAKKKEYLSTIINGGIIE